MGEGRGAIDWEILPGTAPGGGKGVLLGTVERTTEVGHLIAWLNNVWPCLCSGKKA